MADTDFHDNAPDATLDAMAKTARRLGRRAKSARTKIKNSRAHWARIMEEREQMWTRMEREAAKTEKMAATAWDQFEQEQKVRRVRRAQIRAVTK